MVTFSRIQLIPNAITLLLWAAVAFAGTYWVLRLWEDRSLPSYTPTIETAVAIDSALVARALGATGLPAEQAPLAGRFVLLGVAAGIRGSAAALIAIDGKPAQAFRVGSVLVDDIYLQSASERQAVLSKTQSGPTLVTLNMPKL